MQWRAVPSARPWSLQLSTMAHRPIVCAQANPPRPNPTEDTLGDLRKPSERSPGHRVEYYTFAGKVQVQGFCSPRTMIVVHVAT